MNTPLFYEDQYISDFTAVIVGTVKDIKNKKGFWLELDKTAFYPEGGGQPADSGYISGEKVLDVRKREGRILHLVQEIPGDTEVKCRIDWDRRFDYMQQHTGQHIISGALVKIGPFPTVSVHQGETFTTIEIDSPGISPGDLKAAEDLSNRIICENCPVESLFVEQEDLDRHGLRREARVSGTVRLIRVGKYDTAACGGIHTLTSGEVGLVKIIGTEKIRGRVRLVWMIGRRAMDDYRMRVDMTAQLMDLLSAPLEGIVEKAEAAVSGLQDAQRTIRLLEEEQARDEARRLWKDIGEEVRTSAAPASEESVFMGTDGAAPVLTAAFEEKKKSFLKTAAEELLSSGAAAVCLTNRIGEELHWIIGVKKDSSFPFGSLRAGLLETIDGKGGGTPPFFQGVGRNPAGAEEFFRLFRESGQLGPARVRP